jgi:hypothetical protein
MLAAALPHDDRLPRTRWFDDGTTPPTVEAPRAGPATIIPFPVTRRVAFIERAVNTHTRYKPAAASRYLSQLIERHDTRLRRYGIDPALVDADVDAFCAAVGMTKVVP